MFDLKMKNDKQWWMFKRKEFSVIIKLLLLIIISVSCIDSVVAIEQELKQTRQAKCERITIPMCEDMPYNLTRMPNFMGHNDQADAAIQVHEFIPLVEIGCSKHLKFFLCSLYAPMCTEQVDVPIPSCQSICEEVKSRCLPVLEQFNFKWPHMLNCSRLPMPENNGLCMQFPNLTEDKPYKHQHHHQQQQHQQQTQSQQTPLSTLTGKQFYNQQQTDKPNDPTDKEKEQGNTLQIDTMNLPPFLYPPRRAEYYPSNLPVSRTGFYNYNPNSIFINSNTNTNTGKKLSHQPTYPILTSNTNYHGNVNYNNNNNLNSKLCYPEFVYIPMVAGKNNHYHQYYQHHQHQQHHQHHQHHQHDPTLNDNTSVMNTGVCAPKCGKDVLFTRSDKNFVEIWMGIWATFCFMSTLFTVLTYWIDPLRFRYPEKPIIFISMCFCISSIAYLIRIYAGSELVSCDKTDSGEYYITLEGLENSGCIIVFILLYYFGMAAASWWVILTITWLLAAVGNSTTFSSGCCCSSSSSNNAQRKWGHEVIQSKSSIFHLFAWAFPAILTIIVLTLRHVDGDELTGLCYIGSQDPNALLYFVIIPLTCLLTVGLVILLLGFCYLYEFCSLASSLNPTNSTNSTNSTRGLSSVNQYDEYHSKKLKKFMIKIGVFTLFYAVPAICVICCHIYEYLFSSKWKVTAVERARQCQSTNSVQSCRLNESIPLIKIFVLKIFMSLLLGISTGIWVTSNKTRNSWTSFCQSTFGRRQRRNFKSPTLTPSSVLHTAHHNTNYNYNYVHLKSPQQPPMHFSSPNLTSSLLLTGVQSNHNLHHHISSSSSQQHLYHPHHASLKSKRHQRRLKSYHHNKHRCEITHV